MTTFSEQKTSLEAERARLIKELSDIASHNSVTGDWEAIPDPTELLESDAIDEADAVEAWNERRAIVAALEMTLHEIDHALFRLTEGDYGTCEVCVKVIEADRLEILPTARTCMAHMANEDELAL
jgi:RNA polymerase-binding transcription factor DksA